MEVKRESSEVQRKRILGSIVNSWMRWPEGIFNLFYRRKNLGRVEVKSAVSQANEFHVEYFDGLQALRDWIENQTQSTQWQINDEITGEWILKQRGGEIQNQDVTFLEFFTTCSLYSTWTFLMVPTCVWIIATAWEKCIPVECKNQKLIFFIKAQQRTKEKLVTQNKFPRLLGTTQASFWNYFKIEHFNLTFAALTLWKSNLERFFLTF